MKKNTDFLISFATEHNGVLRYSDVKPFGISKPVFFRFISNCHFEKVARGIYISPDIFPDELYLLQLQFPKIVFSHETALYLHSLSEMEPSPISVTVERTYNTKSLSEIGIKINYCKTELYDLGLTELISNHGNLLRVYDKERTICDIIKKRKNTDVSVFNFAIREYIKSNEKKLQTLMHYAEKMNMEKDLRNTLEILL